MCSFSCSMICRGKKKKKLIDKSLVIQMWSDHNNNDQLLKYYLECTYCDFHKINTSCNKFISCNSVSISPFFMVQSIFRLACTQYLRCKNIEVKNLWLKDYYTERKIWETKILTKVNNCGEEDVNQHACRFEKRKLKQIQVLPNVFVQIYETLVAPNFKLFCSTASSSINFGCFANSPFIKIILLNMLEPSSSEP